ncbi:hypothetical protein JCM15831A_26070 [Asaia astilbis]
MAGDSFMKGGLQRDTDAVMNAGQPSAVQNVVVNVKQVTFYWVESHWLATHFQVLSYSYLSIWICFF